MPTPGTTILIGSLRIPSMVLAVSTSVATHGVLLATLSQVPWSGSDRLDTPPELSLSRGVPIQVHLRSEPVEVDPPAPRIDVAEPLLASMDSVEQLRVVRHIPSMAADPVGVTLAIMTPVARSTPESDPARQSTPAAKTARPLASAPVPHLQLPLPDFPAIDCVPPRLPEQVEPEVAAQPAPAGVEQGIVVDAMPRPVYPRLSIRLGQEGICVLSIRVEADGTPGRIEVIESSGHRRLDEAAIDAARTGRYRPARHDGRAVGGTIEVPFEFHLN